MTALTKKAYAAGGVDVDLANRLKRNIQTLVRQTPYPQVLLSFRAERSAVEKSLPV